MQRLPQVLLNVAAADPRHAVAGPPCGPRWPRWTELGERGRVLLRASGTEPLVRVMVEAEDEAAGPGRRAASVRRGGAGPGAPGLVGLAGPVPPVTPPRASGGPNKAIGCR